MFCLAPLIYFCRLLTGGEEDSWRRFDATIQPAHFFEDTNGAPLLRRFSLAGALNYLTITFPDIPNTYNNCMQQVIIVTLICRSPFVLPGDFALRRICVVTKSLSSYAIIFYVKEGVIFH